MESKHMEPMLRLSEVALVLHCSERSVQNYIKRGLLVCSQIGGSRRVRQSALEEFIAHGQSKTKSE